jgi:uncharacterized protein
MADQVVSKFPVPVITEIDKGYWEGVQKGVLCLQKCLDCNRLQFFPRPLCVYCYSRNLGWQESKGTGTVYSFASILVPQGPAFRENVKNTGLPIIFALIDLDEGVRITSEIVGCKPDEVKLGARVKVTFELVTGTDFKLPKFRLEKSS